jgi:CRP-like cAMP-binding protein
MMSERSFLTVTDEVGQSALLHACPRRRFARGDFVFHTGEAGDTLYLIRKGRVAVLAAQSLGETRTLGILGINDIFGELSLVLEGRRRTATVQALEPTETLVLSRTQVEELRASGKAIDRFLVDLLARQVERLTGQLIELAEVPAPVRVYRRIVDLAVMFGAIEPGGVIPVTQDKIASMAGVKLRVTSRVIADARADGLLLTGKGQLIILKLTELRRRARQGQPIFS